MAPSFDSAISSLLCGEDNSSIFNDDDDYLTVGEEFGPIIIRSHHRNHRIISQNLNFWSDDSFNGFPMQSEECLALMVEKEFEHLPAAATDNYLARLENGVLDLEARKEAVDWILKVHAHFRFGPLCAYLSINYMDRFLSAYELPKGKAWMMQLLAVACLSLAAKMEETKVPLCVDLQVGESRFVFEARTIQRMELLVLSTLKWRMQSITPFSFIDHFLRKINDDDQTPPNSSILRSTQLILSTIKGIDFLEFRPSEIAAAVAMSVAGETHTVEAPHNAISALIQHVNKEKVIKCVDVMNKSSLMRARGELKGQSGSVPSSVPQSPIGVLDAASCLSYKTEEITNTITTTTTATTTSHNNTPQANKRRKLNRPFETTTTTVEL